MNETFVQLLEKHLDDISVELNNTQFLCEKVESEDDFIEQMEDQTGWKILHKKLVSGLSSTIEIADLYDDKNNELFAVKMGLETNKTIYSLQQSMLAMTILKSNGNYNYNQLYNNVNDIDELRSSNNYSIVWVLTEHEESSKSTAKKYLEKYDSNNLKPGDFESMLVKLKISEWYQVAKQLNFTPKIYFTKTVKVNSSN